MVCPSVAVLWDEKISPSEKILQACEKLLSNQKELASIRLRALWALHAMGLAKPVSLLDDPDEHAAPGPSAC